MCAPPDEQMWRLSRRVRSNMSKRTERAFLSLSFDPHPRPIVFPAGMTGITTDRPPRPPQEKGKKRQIRDGTNVICAVDGLERKNFENMHIENKNGVLDKRLSLTTCLKLQKIFKGALKKRLCFLPFLTSK